MPRNKSVSCRLNNTLKVSSKREIMSEWATNIDSRARELTGLISMSAQSGDVQNVQDLCRELANLIHISMSAIPRITDILINTEPEHPGE